LTKQGFAIWGAEPNPNGYQFVDVTAATAAATDMREVIADYCGSGTVAGYTVLHNRSGAHHGVVVVDLPNGRRTIASTEDAATMALMETSDYCQQAVNVDNGRFTAR